MFAATAFWVCTLLGVPLGIILCRFYRPMLYIVFGVLFLSLAFPQFSITFMSRELYKAATRGFEVHLADLCTLILIGSMLMRSKEFKLTLFPPLMIPQILLVVIGFLSWIDVPNYAIVNSYVDRVAKEVPLFEIGLYPLFELSKRLRGIVLFWTAVNLFQEKNMLRVIIYVTMLIIVYFTFGTLYSRYVEGVHRASTYPFHVNTLNSYTAMLGMLIFPFVYAHRKILPSLMYWFLVGCGMVVIVLTISRSSLAAYGLVGIIITTVCLVKYPRLKNWILIFLTVVISALVLIKSYDSLLQRFTVKQAVADTSDRIHVNHAAVLMAHDHLLGIGPGNFYALYIEKYWVQTKALDPNNLSHNGWFLTLSEYGYPGLLAMIYFWAAAFIYLIIEMRKGWRSNDFYHFPALLGIFGALLVLHIQNLFHFTIRDTSIYFTAQILISYVVFCRVGRKSGGLLVGKLPRRRGH